MNHVYYDLQVDVMPPELEPSRTIDSLLQFKVKREQHGQERDVIDRYKKILSLKHTAPSSHEAIFASEPEPKETPSSSIPTITPMPPPPYRKEEDTYNMPQPEFVRIKSGNVVEDFNARQEKLSQMAEKTGQAIDVCHFYLEMVDWDLDGAIQMFGSLSTGS